MTSTHQESLNNCLNILQFQIDMCNTNMPFAERRFYTWQNTNNMNDMGIHSIMIKFIFCSGDFLWIIWNKAIKMRSASTHKKDVMVSTRGNHWRLPRWRSLKMTEIRAFDSTTFCQSACPVPSFTKFPVGFPWWLLRKTRRPPPPHGCIIMYSSDGVYS